MSLRNFGNQIKAIRCLWGFFTVMLQTIADDDDLRFGFGRNWADFVASRLNNSVVEASRLHMADMLRAESLEGKTVLDIGSGSGIHSLAALRLGAERIISFDYDRDSVATTRKVREHAGSPANWEVMQGSVLDAAFMASLPTADIVYSWGVLHHTGAMWSAVRNAASLLKPDGVFYIALYSSDNYVDPPPSYWMKVKKRYNMSGSVGRRLLEWRYALRFHILLHPNLVHQASSEVQCKLAQVPEHSCTYLQAGFREQLLALHRWQEIQLHLLR
jgi:2-polyprenyl-3-methyl-5-hydroxy-6-metoxy-1,4-benzoquinol methylase